MDCFLPPILDFSGVSVCEPAPTCRLMLSFFKSFGRVRLKPDQALLARLRPGSPSRRRGVSAIRSRSFARCPIVQPASEFTPMRQLLLFLKERGLSALRTLPVFFKKLGPAAPGRSRPSPSGAGGAFPRSSATLSPCRLPPDQVRGLAGKLCRADRAIPLDPAAALTAAPPLIGAGLDGLQAQPVFEGKSQ
jgi:hypothetical protein